MEAQININTRAIPGHLRITDTMWQDFICDPVMAAFVIMGYKLDAFQAARLRYYWWVPEVYDSSGIGSGKTVVDFCFACLRCILIPNQKVGVYYPKHDSGKDIFWPKFKETKGKIFHAQLGETDETGETVGDGKTESGGTWAAHWKNGNVLLLPTPNFAQDASTNAGLRFNTLLVEEYTEVDGRSKGINEQLIGRLLEPCWNQHHPIWGNHMLFTAHAKTKLHPAYNRVKIADREIGKGNPGIAHLNYSYKDFSRLTCHTGTSYVENFRTDKIIKTLRANNSDAEWLGRGLGIWGINGAGWFSEAKLLEAIALGRGRNVTPVTSRAEMEETIQ